MVLTVCRDPTNQDAVSWEVPSLRYQAYAAGKSFANWRLNWMRSCRSYSYSIAQKTALQCYQMILVPHLIPFVCESAGNFSRGLVRIEENVCKHYMTKLCSLSGVCLSFNWSLHVTCPSHQQDHFTVRNNDAVIAVRSIASQSSESLISAVQKGRFAEYPVVYLSLLVLPPFTVALTQNVENIVEIALVAISCARSDVSGNAAMFATVTYLLLGRQSANFWDFTLLTSAETRSLSPISCPVEHTSGLLCTLLRALP
nr:hypothetical protein CFP56_03660 [Quercus suber]